MPTFLKNLFQGTGYLLVKTVGEKHRDPSETAAQAGSRLKPVWRRCDA
jgi:hypothetical protein